jgi:predicted permease
VRAALGAGRRRLVRQLLIESMLVATIGGALGVMISYLTVPTLVSAAAWTLPRADSVGVRLPELAFGLGLGILTALGFGSVPAVAASRSDVLKSLSCTIHATPGRGTRILRSVLVAAQVCLALVILTGATLMIKSAARVYSLPMGFEARNLVVAEVPFSPSYVSEDRRREFRHRLVDAMQGRLGARSVALANSMPYTSARMVPFSVAPLNAADKPAFHIMPFRVVSENYFDVLRIPLVQGRLFVPDDRAGHARVAIVNEQFVREFGGRNLVRTRILSRRAEFVVVGVVGDTRNFALTQPPEAAVYAPLEQEGADALSIAVRGGDTATIVHSMREAVMTLDPDLPVVRPEQVGAKMSRVDAQRGFYLLMLSLFAGLGVTLAGVGIYGVLAHVAGLRTREFGVRMALGAQPGEVKALALREGLRPVMAGLLAGLVGAWWVTDLFRVNAVFTAQLFQVAPHDPWTLVSALLGFLVVAATACYIPARRTARIDPATVLRAE